MPKPLTLVYEFDRFRLERANQRLTRDGLLLVTPGKTLPLLLDLIEHREAVVPFSKLVSSYFPKSPFGEEELTGEILQLRRLLGDTSKEHPILRFTAGEGYQFVADVTEYLGDAEADRNFGAKPPEPASPTIPVPKSKAPNLRVAAAIIGVVLIAVTIWSFLPFHKQSSTGIADSPAESNGTPRIAILPFQSLTGQATDDSFNRRLTEGISNALSKQPGLAVVPAQNVQRYLASGVADPVTAGKQLGAQMIVRGMAQRLAGHIMVKVQLLNTEDGSQIWSTPFDGNPNDVMGLAGKISDKIGQGVKP